MMGEWVIYTCICLLEKWPLVTLVIDRAYPHAQMRYIK